MAEIINIGKERDFIYLIINYLILFDNIFKDNLCV